MSRWHPARHPLEMYREGLLTERPTFGDKQLYLIACYWSHHIWHAAYLRMRTPPRCPSQLITRPLIVRVCLHLELHPCRDWPRLRYAKAMSPKSAAIALPGRVCMRSCDLDSALFNEATGTRDDLGCCYGVHGRERWESLLLNRCRRTRTMSI